MAEVKFRFLLPAQLTFLRHSLMRLTDASDPVMELAVTFRELLDNHVLPRGLRVSIGWIRSELNLLANVKFVRRHGMSPTVDREFISDTRRSANDRKD